MNKKNASKIGQTIFFNLSIVVIAVICYSPGLLNLRITDGLFRAGMSIIGLIVLFTAFIIGNIQILSPEKKDWISSDKELSLNDAALIIKKYFKGEYFGSLAKTTYGQIERISGVCDKAEQIITTRFGKGNATSSRYLSAIDTAKSCLVKNVINMANRMQVFDEKEYKRLQHYQDDDIPDDIQEKQIKLYQENEGFIRKTISSNEHLLLKIETLSMELASGDSGEETQTLLSEINELTKDVKLYS